MIEKLKFYAANIVFSLSPQEYNTIEKQTAQLTEDSETIKNGGESKGISIDCLTYDKTISN